MNSAEELIFKNKNLDLNKIKPEIIELTKDIQIIATNHKLCDRNFKYNIKNSLDRISEFGGVIVETRPIKQLLFVINNYFEKINFPLLIFTSKNTANYVLSNLMEHFDRNLMIIAEINADNLSPNEYNKILLDKDFWSLIPFKRALFFQTDSLICKDSKYKIEDFFEFDYIGSAWDHNRPINLRIDGGSGGFSLRNVDLSKMAIQKFGINHWPGGEDGYFAFHFEFLKGKVAKFDECIKFSTQEFFLDNSFGCHRVELLKQEYKEKFFKYEIQASSILNNGLDK